jgi:hypothetical protein
MFRTGLSPHGELSLVVGGIQHCLTVVTGDMASAVAISEPSKSFFPLVAASTRKGP